MTATTAMPVTPSAESRNWALGAHLSALGGALIGGVPALFGPLIVWLVRRDEDAFAAEHAREALNFNLSVLIYAAAAVVLTVVTLGLGLLAVLPLGALFAVFWLVVTVMAAIRAANGETYRYPLSVRLVR